MTGNNRGPEIDRWTRRWGLGIPWCAAFVSACADEARIRAPRMRSARAKAFLVRDSYTADAVRRGRAVEPGTIAIWTRRGGGHIGIVRTWDGRSGNVVEGNTSCNARGGSQWNGGQVCLKRRNVNSPFSAFRIVGFTPVH
jgi:hypothetical protein